MRCRNCGAQIDAQAFVCVHCGVLVHEPPPKYYKASFVLGILSVCIPLHGFILGLIGLPLACISRRRSAIVLNIVGITLWMLVFAAQIILLSRAAPVLVTPPMMPEPLCVAF
nr:hypothetical protein [Maliibacterium massiliense]